MKICVVGGGSWGTAFARHLGAARRLPVSLWIREEDICREVRERGENTTFLPGFTLPAEVTASNDLAASVKDAGLVFVAVPSAFCRATYAAIAAHVSRGAAVVSLTKGLEPGTLRRMSEVMAEVFPARLRVRIAVLSGPSFANDVAAGHPTAVALAMRDGDRARALQHLISGPTLRVYTTGDITGVEVAGAVKNVIAIAAGILDGLEYGANSRAALITRGLAEITKLGRAMGARLKTFYGLAGMGDLVLTCTGEQSRNHYVGFELGRGRGLADVLAEMKMVAEGVRTTLAVRELSRRHAVETPISDQVYQVLYGGKPPRRALEELMTRTLKRE